MEIRQINFDVARGGVQHRLNVCVGDTLSRTVIARFHSGGEPVSVTSAYIRAIRPDGVQIYATCAVENNSVTYTFTTTDLSCGGELICEFDLHSGESVMTSPRFIVVCADKLYSGEGIVGSNEYEAYISALLKLENLRASAVSGTEASASATVTDSAVQLDFVLPKGDKGEKGDTGARGEKGDKGDTGAQGIQGIKGDKGDKGDPGEQGIQGIKGDKGDPGEQGEKGVTEFATFEIVDGELYAITTDDLHTAFSLNNGHLEVTIE